MGRSYAENAALLVLKQAQAQLADVHVRGGKVPLGELKDLTDIVERMAKMRAPVLGARRRQMRLRREAARRARAEAEAAAKAPQAAPPPPEPAEDGDDRFEEEL